MLERILKMIKPIDLGLVDEAKKRQDNLTKPSGSLGRLEEFGNKIVGITGNLEPELKRKVIFTLAGDHGVVAEDVSAFKQEVTSQMVYNFLRGGAGINVLARHIGADVIVVDMGVACKLNVKDKKFRDKKVNYGTRNFTKGPAMTHEEAIRSIEAGIELLEDELKNGIDILGTGDMGIGNTTSSSAICSCITGAPPEMVTGRGTGIDDKRLENKIRAIKRAIEVNQPDPSSGIDVLAKLGGFEIGGLSGIILAGAAHRIPVVIDGFISGAAALIARAIEPKVSDYLFASHCSVEIGHKILLENIGLIPILDLNLRLGEGTGAALAISIIEASCKILTQMATFSSASVSSSK